ncbi:MAG TPA: hypothetical protein VK731_05845 [Candidatus Cybelea sp.]|jgi:hypothetical protein|nr:hypothetical protein [Candidatus Cybelea sp.]
MNVKAPFGFVTGCHAGDKFMVQATLASMRYYCPNVPVCLVVDGHFDVSDLEREYGLIILRVPELPSTEMRRVIGGNYRAKLAAMWEGPFEFYVWLDSDAIVWGDFTSQVRQDLGFQIFWNEISIPGDALEIPSWLPHFYFDPLKLRQFDANFEWRGKRYFSSGAFACRRNAITFEEWNEIESWLRQVPGLFAWGEMGMLNYIVYAKAQKGQLNIGSANLQHIWAHHGKEELIKDCIGSSWYFPKSIRRPRVAHFCGRKPFLFDRKAYSRPFTIARLEHHRHQHGDLGAWLAVLAEDCGVIAGKMEGRIHGFQATSMKPLHGKSN